MHESITFQEGPDKLHIKGRVKAPRLPRKKKSSYLSKQAIFMKKTQQNFTANRDRRGVFAVML